MTYQDCYEEGRRILEQAEIEEANLDARLLLEYVCGTDRNKLLVHGDTQVTAQNAITYQDLIRKRAAHIPLQHLTGFQEFMGLKFRVNSHVLIPRQDTEILVEEVLKELHDGMNVLDMCTGSGCILISLLHYSNYCKGTGVDISAQALAIAEQNARNLLGTDVCETEYGDTHFRAGDQVECHANQTDVELQMQEAATGHRIIFRQSDLFDKVGGKFDRIVSNPPYIKTAVIPSLMPEVREFEPLQALDGMEDGLFFYRKIIDKSGEYLVRGGRLYFEIGFDQADSVCELMEKAGFAEIEVVRDYAGLNRVVFGTWTDSQSVF